MSSPGDSPRPGVAPTHRSALNRRVVAAWAALCASVVPLLPRDASAQMLHPVLGDYQLDVWRIQDGVRLTFASNLVQTRDRFLWLSTQSGLARFDGAHFRVFDGSNTPALRGRPNLQTYPLVEDRTGVLWVGSDVGLLAYRGQAFLPSIRDSTLSTDLVNDAVVDSVGQVWAITRRGRLFRVTQADGLRPAPGTGMRALGSSMTIDASGDVLIAAGVDGIYRVHNDSITAVALPPAAELRDVTAIAAAPDGSIWLGTTTAIVQWTHGRFHRIAVPSGHARSTVSCFAVSRDGTLWVGTEGAGLYRFDGRRFESVSRATGLSDDRVIDLMIDRDQNVWIATRDGLNRLRRLPFAVLTQTTGLPTEIPGAIARDRAGRIWIASPTDGLFVGHAANGTTEFSKVPEVPTFDLVTTLAVGQHDHLWIGRRSGSVTRATAGRLDLRPSAGGLPPVTDVIEDRDGTLWIGTWHGLFSVRAGTITKYDAGHGLPDDAIHRLYRDTDGALWVATQRGIARRGPGESRFAVVAVPGTGAARAAVLLESPTGTVWVGSANGLARVAGGRPALITARQGLPENWVGAMEPDVKGSVWLGQLGGLTRVRMAELLAVADGRASSLTSVASYQSFGGLSGGDPTAWPHPWSYRDASGRLWFALSHGVAVVDPQRTDDDAGQPPLPHLEEVLIDGNTTPLAPVMTLSPEARRVELRYTGVDLSDGPGVQFRYRLDGFDTAWVQAGTQRAVSYTRLAAGSYRFRVASRASNGPWGTAEASTVLTVLAPLYRRSWFLAVAGAGLLILLWAAHRAVLRTRLAAAHDERSRMAREIHDSLLQGFAGIGLQLHAASTRLALPPAQQPLLDRIIALIDQTLADARGAVWDLRRPHGPQRDLAAACDAAAQRILAGTGIVVRVTRHGRVRRLSPETYAECLRIVEEALATDRRAR